MITGLNTFFIHCKHTVLYGFVVCFYCRDLVVVTSRRLKTTWREPSKWSLSSEANGKRLSCQKLINHLNKVCSEIIGHITFRRRTCNNYVYLRYWRSQSLALREAKYNHDVDRAQLHIQRAESFMQQGMTSLFDFYFERWFVFFFTWRDGFISTKISQKMMES